MIKISFVTEPKNFVTVCTMHPVKTRAIIVLIAVLALNFAVAGSAAASVITVSNTDQAADFTSIQAAVNAANPGDEIIIKPGTYTENIEINTSLTILSESGSPADTIIQAADSSKNVFSIWANGVKIKGLTIKGSGSASGVHFFGVADCFLEHNILSNNRCGIDLYMFSSGNTLINNNISDSLTGISLSESLNNNIKSNSVSHCKIGISLFDSAKNTLENNTVSENDKGFSLTGESNGNLLVSNILKYNNQAGLRIYETSNNLIYNNYFNNTVNVESGQVAGENTWNTTRSGSTNIVGGPYLGGNFWGMPDGTVYPRGVRDIDLDGIFDSPYDIESSGYTDYLPLKESNSTVITVSNSEDQVADFSSIQSAVDNSYPGDTILVYPGVYVENIEIGVKDLSLISASGSPSDTIVKAASGLDNIFSVTADGVEINGFHITGNISFPDSGIHLYEVEDCRIENNELFISPNYLFNSSGGSAQAAGNNSGVIPGFGVRLDLSGNNILDNNTISYSHAGILLRNSGGNMLLENRVSSSSYGIWVDSSVDNMLDSNLAADNKIGIYLKASGRNSILNNTALNSSGSCINLWDSSENTLNDNIASNSSNVCIILHNSSENNLSNNTASSSSYGIWLESSSNNNSLSGNGALYNNIGIYLKDSNKNKLGNNTALNNSKYGISLWNSVKNDLIKNTASYSEVSVILHNASMNVMASNTVSNSNYGIWLDSLSNNNTLVENEVSGNKIGIYLKASGNNVLTANSANLNTLYGIYLNSATGNTINTNRIVSNSGYGMYLLNSRNNKAYDNYLNNTKNLYFDSKSSANLWNVSKRSGANIAGGSFTGGNFWASPERSGFSQTHQDADHDGICEMAYVMGKGNVDYLPLAGSI